MNPKEQYHSGVTVKIAEASRKGKSKKISLVKFLKATEQQLRENGEISSFTIHPSATGVYARFRSEPYPQTLILIKVAPCTGDPKSLMSGVMRCLDDQNNQPGKIETGKTKLVWPPQDFEQAEERNGILLKKRTAEISREEFSKLLEREL